MAQSHFDKKSISQILTKYLIFVRMFQNKTFLPLTFNHFADCWAMQMFPVFLYGQEMSGLTWSLLSAITIR